MNNNQIGLKIKEYRKDCRMTQQHLADRLGKSVATIKKYENGQIIVPLNVLNDIASILNINNAALLGLTVYQDKQESILNSLRNDQIDESINSNYVNSIVNLNRLLSRYPDNAETVLTIMTRIEFLLGDFYLKKGANTHSLVTENLNLLDDLTRDITTLLTRDTVLNPIENISSYNEKSLQTIQDINIVLNKLLKNKIAMYSKSHD